TEVNPLFEVRPARGELAPDGKVSAPGPTAARHGNRHLGVEVLREESSAQLDQLNLQTLVDAVANDIEEPTVTTGAADLLHHSIPALGTGHERRDVDDGDVLRHLPNGVKRVCRPFSSSCSCACS